MRERARVQRLASRRHTPVPPHAQFCTFAEAALPEFGDTVQLARWDEPQPLTFAVLLDAFLAQLGPEPLSPHLKHLMTPEAANAFAFASPSRLGYPPEALALVFLSVQSAGPADTAMDLEVSACAPGSHLEPGSHTRAYMH